MAANTSNIDRILYDAVTKNLNLEKVLMNRTKPYDNFTSNYSNVTESPSSKADVLENENNNASQIFSMTSTLASFINGPNSTVEPGDSGSNDVSPNSDSATLAKITALLVITAVVLVVSYRFVVRLFLGYSDRKEDMFTDGFSDDEDSGVNRREMDDYE